MFVRSIAEQNTTGLMNVPLQAGNFWSLGNKKISSNLIIIVTLIMSSLTSQNYVTFYFLSLSKAAFCDINSISMMKPILSNQGFINMKYGLPSRGQAWWIFWRSIKNISEIYREVAKPCFKVFTSRCPWWISQWCMYLPFAEWNT